MKIFIACALLLLWATGCAPIQHTVSPVQALDKPLLAGVGDVVLRLNKERNLENVYGKSITDPCLGWEDSEKLVKDLAEYV